MKKIKQIYNSVKNKFSKTACAVSAGLGTLALSSLPVSADNTSLTTAGSKVTEIINQVKGIVTAIFIPAATVAFIIALIIRLVTKNPRAAEEATSWMKRILVCVIIYGAISLIFNFCQTLFV